jgi:hypothetical protein
MVARRQAFPALRGCLSDLPADSRSVRKRRLVCAKEEDLGVTSVDGLLKAKRNWDRETETSVLRKCSAFPAWHGTTRYDSPSKLSKSLLKRSPLEATHNKESRRFDKILLCFGLSPSLSGNVQRGTMGYVPTVLFLHDAEKLKLSLDHCVHAGTPGR